MSAIDYDLTKIKAFALDVDGVLSPSTIPTSADGQPVRMVNVKDGYAIQLAVKLGFGFAIITGGASDAVAARYKALGIDNVYQRASAKLPVLERWMADNGYAAESVLYMGDDIPDLAALRAVGLPCCPYDAAWEVRQTVRYISRFTGGHGCVRDVIEQVLKVQGMWLRDDASMHW